DERNSERPIGKELAQKTCSHYFECVRHYETILGRAPEVEDLEPSRLNQFLNQLHAAGYSAYTVKNRRTGLTKLLRFARKKRLTKAKSRDVRPVLVPTLEVAGYDVSDMRAFISYAATLRHCIRGTNVPRSLFWCSLAPTKWEIGIR